MMTYLYLRRFVELKRCLSPVDRPARPGTVAARYTRQLRCSTYTKTTKFLPSSQANRWVKNFRKKDGKWSGKTPKPKMPCRQQSDHLL